MQTRNNEITIQRGETFTLSKKIVNKDGSPFVISNRLVNPYWLVTIASSRYSNENRQIFNKWLNLKDVPRFDYVNPIMLTDISDDYTFANTNIPSGYEGNKIVGYANVAIFCGKDVNGVISYKYWEYNNNEENDYSGKWVDYSCPIVTTYSKDMTSQFIEQNYLYSISLVTGPLTEQYIKDIAMLLGLDVIYKTVEALYNEIKDIDASLLEGIDVSRPLTKIDDSYEILKPTRLTVQSSLRGGTLL